MKTKKEILHAFIDAVMDLESTSDKRVHFTVYATTVSFHVVISEDRSDEWIGSHHNIYWGGTWNGDSQLEKAIAVLAGIKAIPDESFRETVQVTLDKSKALELGLIA